MATPLFYILHHLPRIFRVCHNSPNCQRIRMAGRLEGIQSQAEERVEESQNIRRMGKYSQEA